MSAAALLSDDELALIGRYSLGMLRVKEAIDRLNLMAYESSLPIRQVETFPLALPGNDISQLLFSHELAVKLLQANAMERMAA